MADIDELLANDEQRAQQDGEHEQRAQQDENDLKSVLESPHGRRVLIRILQKCALDHSSFYPGSADTMAFAEGRKDVGLWLSALLSRHQALYLLLLREQLYGSSEQHDNL